MRVLMATSRVLACARAPLLSSPRGPVLLVEAGSRVLSCVTGLDSEACARAGVGRGGGDCQFVFHELRKRLVLKRGGKCQ